MPRKRSLCILDLSGAAPVRLVVSHLRMSFPRTHHLAVLLAISAFSASAGELVLTNQPAAAEIVRFEVARMPPKSEVWRQMPRADGDFVLSVIRDLKEWHPKWDASGGPDYIVPPPKGPIVRAVTKSGGHYYVMFAARAEFVWVGSRLLEVPGSTSTQIVQRVEKALRK
jgi:hypothetical protein